MLMRESDTVKITVSDKILEKTVLRFIPLWVQPNHVTLFRLVLIPVIILFFNAHAYAIGGVLFAFAAFSDAVDGALARTRNQITDIGKILDPFVDKVLIGTAVVLLVPQYLGWVLVILVLLFEVLFVLNAFMIQKKQSVILEANWSGKGKMIAQSVGIVALLLFIIFEYPIFLTVAEIILYISLALAAISLFIYRSI